MGLASRFKNAWNAFNGRDPTEDMSSSYQSYYGGTISSSRPDRSRVYAGRDRSIINSIYNRIAVDAASISIEHVRLDEEKRYLETIEDSFNDCLTLEANKDQTAREFIQDIVMSMLDDGYVAVVPVDTTENPKRTASYEILTMRTGRIVQWAPDKVKVNLYNDRTGKHEEIIVEKENTAIITNPWYVTMNEPNSTYSRLIRKLNLSDAIDEKTGSSKLDLIIQLPYVVKTTTRKAQAEARRKDIEMQLTQSQYGIAYTDGTERIVQLNRPVENNMNATIESLTSMLYSQLGITAEIMNGTADANTMENYYARVIEPILSVITTEFTRKFLTRTARSQRQSISFFREPFKLVPAASMADTADKFTRNEIMTANEIRQVIGMKPSKDPGADELRNKNLYAEEESAPEEEEVESDFSNEESDLNDVDSQLDDLESMLAQDAFGDDDLAHYASPYYDPVKAHEYYEEHKKLKARTSTASLNEEGKNAARYVKEQLQKERKEKDTADRDSTNNKIDRHSVKTKNQISSNSEATKAQISQNTEKMKAEVARHKERMQNSIDNLRDYVKNLSPEDKKRIADRVKERIASLREENAGVREQLRAKNQNESYKLRESNSETNSKLRETHKETSSGLRDQHKQTSQKLREEYDRKYIEELDKIRSESSFQKPKKK